MEHFANTVGAPFDQLPLNMLIARTPPRIAPQMLPYPPMPPPPKAPSRSQWCMHNGVAASSKDLSARCGRLTADVAGKVVELINAYLANHAYTAAAIDTASSTCLGCHPASSATTPVASGMSCTSCHPDKTTVPHP